MGGFRRQTASDNFTSGLGGHLILPRSEGSYSYDSLNRLLSKGPISFTYTATGQRLTMTDPSGTTSYTYDNRDRLLTKATPQGTLTYTYQPNGLVASVVSSNANGVNVGYSYDSLNRLQTVTDNRLANSTTMTYNDASEPLTMAYPSGVTQTIAHDPNGRVSSLVNNRGASYTYARRLAGAIESATESARTVNYGYDLVQKLLSESITPNNWSLAYTHDPVGNRLTRTSNVPGLPTVGSTYDANDRLATDTYDSNGNTLTSNGHSFAYL